MMPSVPKSVVTGRGTSWWSMDAFSSRYIPFLIGNINSVKLYFPEYGYYSIIGDFLHKNSTGGVVPNIYDVIIPISSFDSVLKDLSTDFTLKKNETICFYQDKSLVSFTL